jgi:hypothetical protein
MSSRRLPPEVRARLLAIPGEAGRIPSRRLPPTVRARLLAIPATTAAEDRSSWTRRWLLDGRLAVAASTLLALLAAPLVDAAVEPSRAASVSLASRWATFTAAADSSVDHGEATLRRMGERLRLESLQILCSTHQDLVATGSLLEESWTATLEWWRSPSDSPKPQGD